MNSDKVKEPNINKFRINVVFNEGMDAFLKENKSIHGCPYREENQNNDYYAWREGFFHAASEFIDKIAKEESIKILNYPPQNIQNTKKEEIEEVEIVEIKDK